jgi:signal peptidase I
LRLPWSSSVVAGRRKPLLAAVALLGLAAVFPWKAGVVVGTSMSPTFSDHSLYVLDRTHYRSHPVGRGDVVVFDHNGKTFIKRVVALGGETVTLLKDRAGSPPTIVEAEREKMLRRLVAHPLYGKTYYLRRVYVPEGSYFLVGDNRNGSIDSCELGPIPSEAIRGKVYPSPPEPPSLRVAVRQGMIRGRL